MNTPNWKFSIDLDAVAHIAMGEAYLDLDKEDQKKVKNLFEKQVRKGIIKDLKFLQQSGHNVNLDKDVLTILNVHPERLMDFCDKMMSWVGGLGYLYRDDLYAMLPVDDIQVWLDCNNDGLAIQFEGFIEENFDE